MFFYSFYIVTILEVLILGIGSCNVLERIEELEREQNRLQDMVSRLEHDTHKPDDPVMAFSVALSQDTTVADAQRVPFDQVLIDVGEGWRFDDYEYDCPLDGYYAFSVAIQGPPVERGARVCVVKNTDTSVRTCAKAYQRATTVDTGTHMAYGVFTCEAQSSIYVMAYTNGTDPNSYLLAGATFQGFLIN